MQDGHPGQLVLQLWDIVEDCRKHLRSGTCMSAQRFHPGVREVQDIRKETGGRCLRGGAARSHL